MIFCVRKGKDISEKFRREDAVSVVEAVNAEWISLVPPHQSEGSAAAHAQYTCQTRLISSHVQRSQQTHKFRPLRSVGGGGQKVGNGLEIQYFYLNQSFKICSLMGRCDGTQEAPLANQLNLFCAKFLAYL